MPLPCGHPVCVECLAKQPGLLQKCGRCAITAFTKPPGSAKKRQQPPAGLSFACTPLPLEQAI